jgi:rSAM/selenodomain-associated transferase 1
VRGVIGAGTKILFTIFREALRPSRADRPKRHLIVFTRCPEPGRTKTRMIGALGPDGAAQLQTDMTRHTLRTAEAMRASNAAVEVRYEGGDGPRMRRTFGRRLHFVRQGDGDLGRRMARATHAALVGGAERVVVIGTDCPELSADLIDQAFEQLGASDVVLGPAKDGGYYLIGLSRPLPALFDGPDWGGEHVLRQTLDIANSQGLSVHLLDELHDVDRPEDLTVWQRVRFSGA